EPRTCGDICEMSVPIIMIKSHGRGFLVIRGMPGPKRRVYKQQVLGSIIVKIEECGSATHGFRQQLFSISPVVVLEGNSSGGGGVGKAGCWNVRVWPVRDCRGGYGLELSWMSRGLSLQIKERSRRSQKQNDKSDDRPTERPGDDGIV